MCMQDLMKFRPWLFKILRKHNVTDTWTDNVKTVYPATNTVYGGITMMGSSSQYYIPSFMEISPSVSEKKIFEGFLPYMGVAAILVMWPRCGEQTFVPSTQGGSLWNLALIGQVVSEKKITDDGRTPDHGYTISSPMSLWLRLAKKRTFSSFLFTHRYTTDKQAPPPPPLGQQQVCKFIRCKVR